MCVFLRACVFFWDLRLALFLPSASGLCGEIENPQTISSASQIHLRLGEGEHWQFPPAYSPIQMRSASKQYRLSDIFKECMQPSPAHIPLLSILLPASLLKNWMGRNTGLLQGEKRFWLRQYSSKTALCLLPTSANAALFLSA